MTKTLKEISEIIDGDLCGDGKTEICGVSGIKEARPGEITFVANPRYRGEMDRTRASAIIIGKDIVWNGKPVIRVENPYFGFVKALELFASHKRRTLYGIDETAIIGQNISIGEQVSIQAYTVLRDNVQIGDNTIIGPLVYIGDNVKLVLTF